jgi:hypothetical protein
MARSTSRIALTVGAPVGLIQDYIPGRYEMAFLFHRRLAVPLWAIAFFAIALIPPPPTATLFLLPSTILFAITGVGIAAIVSLMPRPIPWLRTCRAVVRVLPCGQRDHLADYRMTSARGDGRRIVSRNARIIATNAAEIAVTSTREDGLRESGFLS